MESWWCGGNDPCFLLYYSKLISLAIIVFWEELIVWLSVATLNLDIGLSSPPFQQLNSILIVHTVSLHTNTVHCIWLTSRLNCSLKNSATFLHRWSPFENIWLAAQAQQFEQSRSCLKRERVRMFVQSRNYQKEVHTHVPSPSSGHATVPKFGFIDWFSFCMCSTWLFQSCSSCLKNIAGHICEYFQRLIGSCH
jgi:hypothetical protein